MKQKPLKIHSIFPIAGETMQQIILRSFALYLRRTLPSNDSFMVSPE